jgi:hypothetical protein
MKPDGRCAPQSFDEPAPGRGILLSAILIDAQHGQRVHGSTSSTVGATTSALMSRVRWSKGSAPLTWQVWMRLRGCSGCVSRETGVSRLVSFPL